MATSGGRLRRVHQLLYLCGVLGIPLLVCLAGVNSSNMNENSNARSKSRRSASPIMTELLMGRGRDYLTFENNDLDTATRLAPQRPRNGKDLLDDPFPFNQELAMNISNVQKSVTMPPFVVPKGVGRQNPNPDIQDIITGIVKLLNGNVNVHANTQPTRRHSANRINNRGPPRISEAQPPPPPSDYEADGSNPPPTSSRPLHTYERPDGPVRPFLTGVPIPEQIVPSMQQTYRPGFVSQNRPPWQRPKPRPPISPNRRPIPPYKPYPTNVDYRPDVPSAPAPIPAAEGNSIAEVTEKPIEEPLDTTTKAAVTSPLPTTSPEPPETTSAATTERAKDEPPKPEKHASKKVSKPTKATTEVQYTIASATSAASVMGPPVTFETDVPSVYEINSIQYLPSGEDEAPAPTVVNLEPSTSDTVIPTVTSEAIESSSLPTPTPTTGTPPVTPTILTTAPAEIPSPSIAIAPSSTSTTTSDTIKVTSTSSAVPTTAGHSPDYRFQPRPGLVLDDPDFKPGGANNNAIRTQGLPYNTRPEIYTAPPATAAVPRPPAYGDIFDVTLSAIQGPGSGSGSQQTVKLNPYYNRPPARQPNLDGDDSIILSASGTDGFVSIDGKRSYIDLFGEKKTAPASSTVAATSATAATAAIADRPKPTKVQLQPGIIGTGYAVAETEPPPPPSAGVVPGASGGSAPAAGPHRVHHQQRPKFPMPPVRIDTCIVGDDSTCDQAQNERCRTEAGVSSCHCRPGYARRKHREPCRRIVSLMLSMRVDKIYERRIHWDASLGDRASEKFQQLSYEAVRAMDSAMSMTPFSDEFLEARINGIYTVNPAAAPGTGGVYVNYTLHLDENAETLRPALRSDIQRHLLGVIHRRHNNIGNSALYVDSPTGAVSSVLDVDECTSDELHDCADEARCTNAFGTFRCECNYGYRDPWADQPSRAGRECLSCPESYCNNRGTCIYDNANNRQVCRCLGSYYGTQCEIDGEVLGVAVGASVAAVIIIVLTLICLVMWSRKWQREHKNAIGSPIFGYLGNGQVKTPVMGQAPYQVTLEDRMRWAQIADVMAQANHYAAEPVAGGRPASAMFGYPNIQTIGSMNTLSLHGTLPMHGGTLPPVPLPRTLGLPGRNGMRTLENSSSSEEEDRTDLLGRNFNVPRPKSRSNASVTSGIYYDVDYAPTGAEQLYGSTLGGQVPLSGGPAAAAKAQSNIPMSTYTSGGRTMQSTYYK